MHKYNGGYIIQPEIIVFPWENGCFANKTRGISIEPWYEKWFQHGNCSPGRALMALRFWIWHEFHIYFWSNDFLIWNGRQVNDHMPMFLFIPSGLIKTETPRASARNSYKFHPFFIRKQFGTSLLLKDLFPKQPFPRRFHRRFAASFLASFQVPIPALWLRRDSDIAMWKLECWEGWGFPAWATKLSQGQGMDRAWLQTRFTPQQKP